MNELLLINPPFCMPDKPPIGIPVLARCLRDRGYGVNALDFSMLLYRQLLSAENLRTAKEQILKRFTDLNNKDTSEAGEKDEHLYLGSIIDNILPNFSRIKSVFEDHNGGNADRIRMFHAALVIACAPRFPEKLDFTPNTRYVRYKSRFSNFSTEDIYQSANAPALYHPVLKELVDRTDTIMDHNVIGISVTFPDQIQPAVFCAKLVKQKNPDAIIILGGAFVSSHMRNLPDTRLFDYIDFIILDDGELPLEALLQKVRIGEINYVDIPGVLSRNTARENDYVHTRLPVASEMSAPDYSVFPLDQYLIKPESMALLFRLSRGCYWAKCSFCRTELSLIHDYLEPDHELVYQQLKKTISDTGVKIFHIADNAVPVETITRISRKLQEDGIQIFWVANFRLSSQLTPERLALYKAAGCRTIYFGLESCTPRILKLMSKGISIKSVETVLENCRTAGIHVVVYMITGFPSETEEEARESFEYILHLKERGLIKDCVYNIFELVMFSRVYSEPEKFGVKTIVPPRNLNLDPPITAFTSTGMTRSRAGELCQEFVRRLDSPGEPG